jgi:Asp-tRNA(Asn)/Glu-tRNA(Gln) amidotransferase A subunit family amidase
MVPVALGTQTAGSIVRPASFCGIYGYKPTFGAVPTDGVKAIGPSLDTIGPLARTVDDLALTGAVLSGTPGPAPSNRAPSIAFARTWEWDRADATTREAIYGLVARLDLPEVTLPEPYADLVDVQTTIMEAEVAVALAPEHRAHPEQLSGQLRELLARGLALGDDVIRRARDHAARCRTLLPSVFAGYDVLLVPSAVGEAPEGLAATGDPVFCRIWTLLGTPAVAIPGLRGPHGMPLGVQVVADLDDDAAALAAAQAIGDTLAQEAP